MSEQHVLVKNGNEGYHIKREEDLHSQAFFIPNGRLLQAMLRVEPRWFGHGGNGEVHHATMIDEKGTVDCVVKLSIALLENGIISIGNDGVLRHNTGRVMHHRDPTSVQKAIEDINHEIKYGLIVLLGPRMARAFTQVHHQTSLEDELKAEAERNRIQRMKGHEFIHHILMFDQLYIPCIISELCDGDVHLFHGSFVTANDEVNALWHQVAHSVQQGLLYMHRLDVAHNDIKPDNVFYKRGPSGQYRFLISDFGACTAARFVGKTYGTPHYNSPEQLHQRHEYAMYDDAYAFAKTCMGLPYLKTLEGLEDFDITTAIINKSPHVQSETGQQYPTNQWPLKRGMINEMLDICRMRNPVERYRTFANMHLYPSQGSQVMGPPGLYNGRA